MCSWNVSGCGFKLYMPMKPMKYELKILCLTDAENNYFYNWSIYCEKNADEVHLSEEEKRYSKPTHVVLCLSMPFLILIEMLPLTIGSALSNQWTFSLRKDWHLLKQKKVKFQKIFFSARMK